MTIRKYDYTNIEIREQAERLINNEVYICQSSLIDYLLKRGIFNYEDVHNMEYSKEELKDMGYNEDDNEYKDIFEWYAISTRLAEDLQELGYPVLINEYGQWMGRTTTGQSLILDSIIYQVLELIDKRVNEVL